MKERLVEDWLSRINERGYEVPFSQALISTGHRVLRCGHSPTEHGKDILSVMPDGTVAAYQLKTGDLGQKEITNYLAQIQMLVETRPIFPGLIEPFDYRPFLVTAGEFKQPAVSLVKELNASWRSRNLHELELINGRELHIQFVSLAGDFWPIEPPEVRRFRQLYLVDGRGDLDLPQFAEFLNEILKQTKSSLDFERSVAAANIFASYLLGEFYRHEDHWSIFQGWTVCASQIAGAAEGSNFAEKHWKTAFDLGKRAACGALASLAEEARRPDALKVNDRELDELTRTRNTTTLAAVICSQLLGMPESLQTEAAQRTTASAIDLFQRKRLYFWGEGALSQFILIIWLFEQTNNAELAKRILVELISAIAVRNAKNGERPFEDPYTSADECLKKLFNSIGNPPKKHRQVVESYSLLPLILLAARRNFKSELEQVWKEISNVDFTWFRPDVPADHLRWHCETGKEFQARVDHPQSWKELRDLAFRDEQERLANVLRNDRQFALLFMLAFPHRTISSLVKYLDDQFGRRA